MAATQRTYLDYNATAPLLPEAAEALTHALQLPGNPSSVHAEGRAARALVETARDRVAALAGARAGGVTFTSGGSEAANLVMSPGFRRLSDGARPERLLVCATEHVCVLEGHRFPEDAVERIPVDRDGVVDLAWLERRLAELAPRRVLVSVHLANNETGVIQPLARIAERVRAHGGLVHSDAVQAAGRIPVDMAALGVDALTLSGHKLGAPKGVGALVLASEGYELAPLVRGGGQERGRRGGTENVAGIAAFGAAAEAVLRDLVAEGERLSGLRGAFEAAIGRLSPGSVVLGAGAPRLPNTVLFATPGLRAETALIAFDLAGVALSSGSACSSGKVRRSHVLDAMGVAPALAEGALRLSMGRGTTAQAVETFAAAYEKALAALHKGQANAA
ncbi:cysteine desulfurase family protein [Salinarimonas soli]|uniref:Cysteine desulfurase n=1 Tax=Salinarimonas soli TaxID=1638099 RepID=A0A5B2V774_9HYPH|nr:cysteine desulfurase family protein [Salinarimonas soli]KAA2235343.1 cysteine desulfurase [Salinarimonas soli]